MGLFGLFVGFMIGATKNPKTCVFLKELADFRAFFDGRGGGARTHDPLIKSQLLFQLSYASIQGAPASYSGTPRVQVFFCPRRLPWTWPFHGPKGMEAPSPLVGYFGVRGQGVWRRSPALAVWAGTSRRAARTVRLGSRIFMRLMFADTRSPSALPMGRFRFFLCVSCRGWTVPDGSRTRRCRAGRFP